jgi:hypothetical protein
MSDKLNVASGRRWAFGVVADLGVLGTMQHFHNRNIDLVRLKVTYYLLLESLPERFCTRFANESLSRTMILCSLSSFPDRESHT